MLSPLRTLLKFVALNNEQQIQILLHLQKALCLIYNNADNDVIIMLASFQ